MQWKGFEKKALHSRAFFIFRLFSMFLLSFNAISALAQGQYQSDFENPALTDPFWDVVSERGGDSSRFQLHSGWFNWMPDTVNYDAGLKISYVTIGQEKSEGYFNFTLHERMYLQIEICRISGERLFKTKGIFNKGVNDVKFKHTLGFGEYKLLFISDNDSILYSEKFRR